MPGQSLIAPSRGQNNDQNFLKAWFEETTDDDSYLLYLTLGPVTSGIIGCTLGGIVTDYLRRVDWMNSVQAALLVETVAHAIATPIMVMVLTLEAPYCFIGIFLYPLFAEMWMGVYLIGTIPRENPQPVT